MSEPTLTKIDQLKTLDTVEPEKATSRDEEQMRLTSLSRALRTLAHLDHDKEYEVCRTTATHILGRQPDTDSLDYP